MSKHQLIAIKKFQVKITLKTGLHIGADKTDIAIGDIDNPVVKLKFVPFSSENNPDEQIMLENVPYIPGSSLKGKLRSLVEYSKGEIDEESTLHVITDKCINTDKGRLDCEVCKYFGVAYPKDKDKREEIEKSLKGKDILPITRLVFRDLIPTKEWLKLYAEMEEDLDKEFYEIKTENKINRFEGKAENPRKTERVPAGVEFEGEILLKIFKEDLNTESEEVSPETIEEYTQEVLEKLQAWMKLLENDYLGGSGSRGYGQVEVEVKLQTDEDEESSEESNYNLEE